MIPLALKLGDITFDQAVAFRLVCELFKVLPDGMTCHEMAAECVRILTDPVKKERVIKGMRLARGRFNGVDHSWIAFEGTETIIDVYPWAGVVPAMYTLAGSTNPQRSLYVEESCPSSTTP